MKKLLFSLLLIANTLLQLSAQSSEYSNYEPTINPDRIMLTLPGDPATMRAVSWRTIFQDTVSIGEITVTSEAPDLEEKVIRVTGTCSPWEVGSAASMGHQVVFSNLKPDTQYAYRVGNGKNWSEWFQFKTSLDGASPFSFLYFGDVQNDIKSYCSRTLRQAWSHFPKSDFMLFAGDLVSRSQEEYWREFFYAGGWMFGMMPSVATPGNHEYDKPENQPRTFSKHWKQIFNFPQNAPSEEFSNRVYYFDYQGVRFISVDSPGIGESDEDGTLILEWLDKVLANNSCKWTVVFTHYPVYSCSQGRENENYRNAIKPILEKYGVDLVLQGHDHTYCRGFNLPKAGANRKNAPMYIVSVTGPKMYGLNTSFWSDRVASETQLYQHIAVNEDVLTFQSFTVAGNLYDEFQLIKGKNGRNRFVESKEVSRIQQRTAIPEEAKEKYTKEDMDKYLHKFENK